METAAPSVSVARHPLEPLSADEIELVTAAVKRAQGLGDTARFVYVMLKEPSKVEVLNFKPGDSFGREAFIVIRERAEHATYEATVSIASGEVTSWKQVPDVQPAIMAEEFMAAEEAVKKDPRWRAAMLKRGISEEELELAVLDAWSVGYYGPEDAAAKGRFIRPLTWLRSGPNEHSYARPVEGLTVRFDLDRMEVVEVEDAGVVPLATKRANYTADGITKPDNVPYFPEGLRKDVKPLDITQPQGPSFEIDGYQIRWQKWHLRIGFTPREGLVLYQVGYEDKGALRPIVYRASVSEMFIPYGDPNPTHYRKNVFDMGEYGIGVLLNSLELGCDCLGEIRYFDAVVNDNDGKALTLKNAICLHEEDHGILWKHKDFRTMETEVRRGRRLVLSSIATIGNYEYGYFWYFYQDGTIEYEIKMTGVMSNGAVPPGQKPKHGALVAPGVYGPNHQHFFGLRLDMAVDGINNSVYECDSEAVPAGPENPHGNAWVVSQRLLARESEAQSIINPLAARYWKITNPAKTNGVGEPVAYKLVPGDNILPFYQPDRYPIKRAGFVTKHLWVTAYHPAQMYAAGDYPNQNAGGDGLPSYVKGDRPLENTDVVLWYTMGAHHPVRPEEWPVMPVMTIGFHLKPHGFFDGNPGMDVPFAMDGHHVHGSGNHGGVEAGRPQRELS
jgi:primary-amine oxidase